MSHKKNVLLLAGCQALLLTNAVTLIAVGALAGYALAADKVFSTLPATAYVLGGALTAFPASMYMKRVGRRAGFLVASASSPSWAPGSPSCSRASPSRSPASSS